MLKLHRERSPYHEHESIATRVAEAAGLSVLAVIDGLIEVDDRQDIVLERIDGPSITRHLELNPDQDTRSPAASLGNFP